MDDSHLWFVGYLSILPAVNFSNALLSRRSLGFHVSAGMVPRQAFDLATHSTQIVSKSKSIWLGFWRFDFE